MLAHILKRCYFDGHLASISFQGQRAIFEFRSFLPIDASISSFKPPPRLKVARFFLTEYTKTGKNMPNYH
jgi:hypothetical protein